MVLFNHATREMTAKIVYYGPGLCGKTTNLMVIFDLLDPSQRGKMLSLATKTDRTLFFDLLPVDIGKVGAFSLKIQLYTVPGQVFYNETRKLVLKGADAVVFVADSQPSMVESNRESFANLLENLNENQLDANDMPIVVQYNKRDIPGVLPVEDLQESLGLEGYPFVEAAAIQGEGVMETFKLISKMTAKHLMNRLKPGAKVEVKSEKKKSKAMSVEALAESVRAESSKKKKAAAPEPPPVTEEPPQLDVNPFGDLSAPPDVAPFAEEALANDYEKVEEVSLEQLLEGRDRPTFSGNTPLPVDVDEVEALDEAALVIDPEPLTAVAVEDVPIEIPPGIGEEPFEAPSPLGAAASSTNDAAITELREMVQLLRIEVKALREEHDRLIEHLARSASEIRGNREM